MRSSWNGRSRTARHDPGLRATALATKSLLLAVARVERIAEAEELAAEAQRLAAGRGRPAALHARQALTWARILRGQPIPDPATGRQATGTVTLYESSTERPAAIQLAFSGRIGAARARLRDLLALADERGETRFATIITMHRCELELRAGDRGNARGCSMSGPIRRAGGHGAGVRAVPGHPGRPARPAGRAGAHGRRGRCRARRTAASGTSGTSWRCSGPAASPPCSRATRSAPKHTCARSGITPGWRASPIPARFRWRLTWPRRGVARPAGDVPGIAARCARRRSARIIRGRRSPRPGARRWPAGPGYDGRRGPARRRGGPVRRAWPALRPGPVAALAGPRRPAGRKRAAARRVLEAAAAEFGALGRAAGPGRPPPSSSCWGGRDHRRARPHRRGATGRRAGGGRPFEQADRQGAVRGRAHGRGPPQPRLRQTRRPVPVSAREPARAPPGRSPKIEGFRYSPRARRRAACQHECTLVAPRPRPVRRAMSSTLAVPAGPEPGS